jgi:cyanophycinase
MRQLLVTALTAFWLAAASAAGPVAGTAVAIGGALRDDNHAVWNRLVELAGGPGAHFAVLATASAEPEASAAAIVANLQRHGAVAEAIPVAPLLPGIDLAAAVKDPIWVDRVRASQAVFFSGGAQARLLDTLRPGGRTTPLLAAVRAVFDGGGVVAGTSSGAAVMSETMFLDAPDPLAALKGRLRDGIEVGRGFGFVPADVVIDQHFLQRGRIGRLLPLLQSRGLPLGIGVEEDSAAVVRGNLVEVVGSRGAVVVDLGGARSDPGAFNVQGVRLHHLAAGDRFDLQARRVSPHAGRPAPLPGTGTGTGTEEPFYPEMLGPRVLYNAMSGLIESARPEVLGLSFEARPAADDRQPDLAFEWRLYKAADTVGWPAGGGTDATVADLRLDVRPVRLARPLYTPWPR